MAQFLSFSFLLAVARTIGGAFRSNQGDFAGTSQLPHRGSLPKRGSCHMLQLLPLLLTIFALTPAVWAQAVGAIGGTITDPAGAVVPSVKVTATDVATSASRTTVTSGSGTYFLNSLSVGTYILTVEATGFKSVTSEQLTLDVNQRREVDFRLTLTESKTEVEVHATPALLNTTSGTLGGLVTGQQVVTLPLNGRDITNLLLLQPGVNLETDSSTSFVPWVSANGNRGFMGSSYLDGIDTTNEEIGGAQFSNFNLDAVAEFRVLQNNYSAEYGRGSATIIQQVSKSGTNEVHGSLFEFVRNSDFDARNFFAAGVPPFKRNEFGVTGGGPVWLPKLYDGRNKTFFFAQYAGYRQVLATPLLEAVPTADERQGKVDIIGANGQPDQLLVPLTATAKSVLNQYPLPNQPNGPLGPNTFNFDGKTQLNENQWSVRGDHYFSAKDSLFARFSSVNNVIPATDPFAASLGPFSSSTSLYVRNFGLDETHIFTPTLLNSMRLGWTDSINDTGLPSGLKTTFPEIVFTDGSLSSWGPDGGNAPEDLRPESYLVNDSVTWVRGRHSMSIGGEFRRVHMNDLQISFGGVDGVFFSAPGVPLPVSIPSASGLNNLAAGQPSPSSLISMMVGAPSSYEFAASFPGYGGPTVGAAPRYGIRRFHTNFWFQDDFNVNRKLTINYGLRYEFNSVPTEVGDRASNVIDSPNFAGAGDYLHLVVNPTPFYRPDYRGWGPRFGYAYKLTEKTVLRGGFGVFTNIGTQGQVSSALAGFNFPVTATGPSTAPVSLTPVPSNLPPPLVDLQGNPIAANGNSKSVPPNTPVNLQNIEAYFGGPILGNFVATDWRDGYTMSGNFTLEQALPSEMLLQLGYVANIGVHLSGSEWPNAYNGAETQYTPYSNASPGLGEFQMTDSFAHSSYNSFQAVLRKTSSKYGIVYQVSYTRSKSIDNASTVYNGPASNSAGLQNNPTCWSCEKSVSGFDFPNRIVGNFVYAIPMERWSALPKKLSRGWQMTGIVQAQSGFPFTVTSPYGTVPFGTDVYYGVQATRPNLLQTPTLNHSGPEEQFFSDAVINNSSQFFGTPLTTVNGTQLQTYPGNLGRNTFRTASFSNVDFSLIKDTYLTEKKFIQLRAEFFNLLNEHAFKVPGTILGEPGFGVSSATVLPERQIQFGLRLVF
jgi:hypothetical protein